MAALWLRFLTEIEDGNESIAPELFDNELTHKALDILQASAFSKEELEAYERYWDAIRKELTYANEKAQIAEVKGRTEGEMIGIEKGKIEGKIEIALQMLQDNEPVDKIMRYTGLTKEQIEDLRK